MANLVLTVSFKDAIYSSILSDSHIEPLRISKHIWFHVLPQPLEANAEEPLKLTLEPHTA